MSPGIKGLTVVATCAIGAVAIALGCTSCLVSLDKTTQTVCFVATGVFITATLYLSLIAWQRSKTVGIKDEKSKLTAFAIKMFVMLLLITYSTKPLSISGWSPYAKMALGSGIAILFLSIPIPCPSRRKIPPSDMPLEPIPLVPRDLQRRLSTLCS